MAADSNKTRLLYVDDETDILHIVKKGLEMEGFEVDTARNAEEALQRDVSQYDMLVIDIRMPVMDGFQLYNMVRHKINPARTRVCFFTAFQTHLEEYSRRFPKWNGACFIVKPVTIRGFASQLRKILGSDK